MPVQADPIPHDPAAFPFSTEVRVRLSETDAVGIVYFGSFCTYMDVGRMDYLNHLRLAPLDGAVRGLAPGAVVGTRLRFHAPARYNDVVAIHVRVADLGRTSYTFQFLMTCQPAEAPLRVVATGELTLVWLDAAFRPMPLPEPFCKTIEAFQQSGRA